MNDGVGWEEEQGGIFRLMLLASSCTERHQISIPFGAGLNFRNGCRTNIIDMRIIRRRTLQILLREFSMTPRRFH